jgi:hypothetical protein
MGRIVAVVGVVMAAAAAAVAKTGDDVLRTVGIAGRDTSHVIHTPPPRFKSPVVPRSRIPRPEVFPPAPLGQHVRPSKQLGVLARKSSPNRDVICFGLDLVEGGRLPPSASQFAKAIHENLYSRTSQGGRSRSTICSTASSVAMWTMRLGRRAASNRLAEDERFLVPSVFAPASAVA